jgi:hypothetical protein
MDRKSRLVCSLAGRHVALRALAALLACPAVLAAQTPTPTATPAATPAATETPAPRSGEEKDKTLEKAGDVATQPVRDVGITKSKIPPVLQQAVTAPYAPPRRKSCASLRNELTLLNEALGPDFDENRKKNEDKAEQLALAGGEMVVNSLIPFRGLVREISGAAPADRRKAVAINAGIARRGFIRGLAMARGCPVIAAK